MGITPFGTFLYHHCSTTGEGGTLVNFCWVFAAGLLGPLPHYSLFCGPVIDPPGPLPWIRHCFTFHLQYKHSGTFATRNYKELSYP